MEKTEINKDNIKRKYAEHKKIMLSIRITPTLSKWLKQQNYSPTGIFMEAVRILGYTGEAQ